MKIVVTGTRGIPGIMGGVETHCENLFPRIAAAGEDVTVIRRCSYVKDNLKQWKGVNLVNIQSPRKKSLEAAIHTFRAINYAARLHADILHINAVGPALAVPYAKMLGLKVVFTHHGPDYDRDKWGSIAKAALKLGEMLGCRYADEVIVISNVIKDNIAARCHRTKNVSLIYNGVPAPEKCDFAEYFERLCITSRRYVFAMGRFVREKRLEDIIMAFERSSLPSYGYKLVIAGDADFEDDYSRSLKALANEKSVVLTGFVKGRELHSLLTNAALYVIASSHEGLPISLLEAMSYNLPVVASDIPANMEVNLPENCYFHLSDTAQLTLKMEEKVNEPSAQYNLSLYDWDEIAKQTLDVYHHCYER